MPHFFIIVSLPTPYRSHSAALQAGMLLCPGAAQTG